MEQLDYNLLFRWFVGLNMDEKVWVPTVFTKNRDRLLGGDIAAAFFDGVVEKIRAHGLLSNEHFTVDGTLLEAWEGAKSFKRKHSRQIRRRIFTGRSARTKRTHRDVARDAERETAWRQRHRWTHGAAREL
jgi:Transposase domain (DUF772)